VVVTRLQRGRFGRDADQRAELLHLEHGALGQLGTGYPRREAEQVVDT
jgi:hypothetical protein